MPSNKPVEFKMTAHRYAFVSNEIRATRGTHERLCITALDGEHGFRLEAFHLDQRLPKGETLTVEFTADRSGEFPCKCPHLYGLRHGKMKGLLIVE
jgi:heme/copper-type cytochrome/quinol oxidase subunit 2